MYLLLSEVVVETVLRSSYTMLIMSRMMLKRYTTQYAVYTFFSKS